ncbi:MAG: glycoside hydrolase family 3 C-terminal domain-containing protein [Planctomycetaceae bacterium]|nr:glycoside hydrolase family 3 C-terminal domain-containing protein [Planctomycetaceae bacterium]
MSITQQTKKDKQPAIVNVHSGPAYLNPVLPANQRVKDLLSRMTLQEKVAQMCCVWQGKKDTLLDDGGSLDTAKADKNHKQGLGQVGRLSDAAGGLDPRRTAETANALQKYFLKQSRLGIPIIIHEEALHGHAAVGASSFSQPIGLGATFDPDLVRRLYEMAALELRARGAHHALTPVLDVAREPRWGRVEETFGEDPYLVMRMGVAAIKGFQGDVPYTDSKHVVATLKHFAAHGQPESGTNCAPVNVSPRILREVFLYPFKKAVEAGAVSVMASYNEIDGIPSHANKWLLHDVLRTEWGFKGFVVSDYFAVRELNERPGFFGQFLAADGKQAARLAVEAGVNIELPDMDCYPYLEELVQSGQVAESLIDSLVAPMLECKFKLGLFEDPYVDPNAAEQLIGCQKHAELTLEAARKTITLLKNDSGVAPLDPARLKTLAVIGPNANRTMLGGYSGRPKEHITVLEGIRRLAGKNVNILYHEGCKITVGGSWQEDEVTLSDPAQDRKSIAEALEVTKQADAIVLVIGGNEQTSREAWERNHMGDRADLRMVGLQDELVDQIASLGKPVITVLFNGSPLDLRNLSEKVPVILECWYLGQQSGQAVAEAIFGKLNPGGKLPVSFPRSIGHIPCYYNYKPSARRGYLFDDVSPLYAFGFGLSYTQFQFSKPRLEKASMAVGESTMVTVDITNTGDRAGDEVVQMYIRDCISSVTRPVKELKGFERITLEPGQTKTVTLDITPELLSFYNIEMKYVVEPGQFEIMVGNSSRDCDLQKVILNVL